MGDLTASEQFLQLFHAGDVVGAIKLAPAAYASWWINLVQNDPWHVVIETALLIFVIYLFFFKKSRSTRGKLTEREVEELIQEWQPAPLVPPLKPEEKRQLDDIPVIERVTGNYVKLEGEDSQLLNLMNLDFLGMSGRAEVKNTARDTLKEYGCGSCGPRGFYGTVLPHVIVEQDVATFMGTAGAISYSDTTSTLSSTIPAFAKRGDLIIVDERVNESLQVGVELSRAHVKIYRHNDMQSLEDVLGNVSREDKMVGRDVKKQRRFIVSEGLFKNTGSIVDLKALVSLKNRFGYRLVLDESCSFGTLGKTGRGCTEQQGVPVKDVDILMVSMAYSLASVGGMCLGSIEVVDHQRLSGAGYCFSASAPPFTSSSASRALQILQNEPKLIADLERNTHALFDGISKIPQLKPVSDRDSPIILVSLAKESPSYDEQARILTEIVAKCRASQVLITQTRTLKGEKNRLTKKPEKEGKVPYLRIVARASLKPKEVESTISALRHSVK